jgi:hypothetical protein
MASRHGSGNRGGFAVKLLVEVAEVCNAYQNETLQNLKCQKVQCDEIWSFCCAKEKNLPKAKRGQFGVGDVWTWTALSEVGGVFKFESGVLGKSSIALGIFLVAVV